jgi:hypothetical protein
VLRGGVDGASPLYSQPPTIDRTRILRGEFLRAKSISTSPCVLAFPSSISIPRVLCEGAKRRAAVNSLVAPGTAPFPRGLADGRRARFGASPSFFRRFGLEAPPLTARPLRGQGALPPPSSATTTAGTDEPSGTEEAERRNVEWEAEELDNSGGHLSAILHKWRSSRQQRGSSRNRPRLS